jgi:hypothetical protein
LDGRYGAAVHFKIYPIVYALAFLVVRPGGAATRLVFRWKANLLGGRCTCSSSSTKTSTRRAPSGRPRASPRSASGSSWHASAIETASCSARSAVASSSSSRLVFTTCKRSSVASTLLPCRCAGTDLTRVDHYPGGAQVRLPVPLRGVSVPLHSDGQPPQLLRVLLRPLPEVCPGNVDCELVRIRFTFPLAHVVDTTRPRG